ncbi:MAG: hypothetical protein M0Z95_11955 [Actinomycetota bacterium]|nr:hypothetical protein [Actinomycetota bacterium]
MPASTTASPGGSSSGGGASALVPFLAATYEYSEPMFQDVVTPGTSGTEFTHNITPGGFLRGITLSVTTTTAGSGLVALPDAPWCLFSSLSIESIDGTPLLYPLPGYTQYLISRFCRPWDGDPAQDPAFSNSATSVSFRLRLWLESRMTIGVVPNTDARAQYRLRYTVSPSANIWSATTTIPTLQIAGYLETYSQPDAANALGQPNAQVPDGLAFQRFTSHEIFPTTGGSQTFMSNRVGNQVRSLILVQRSSGSAGGGGQGVRTDLTADPIRWRKDNAQILVEWRDRADYEVYRFFGPGGEISSTQGARPTGVYVFPRWHNPGRREGQPWLDTTQATYLQYELNGTASGGSLEVITEDLAPTTPTPPAYLIGL